MIPAATIESIRVPPEPTRSRGVWVTAWRRLRNDRVGVVSLVIVAAFALLVLLSFLGIVAGDWQKVAVPDAPPTFLVRKRCRPVLIRWRVLFERREAGGSERYRSARPQVRRVEGAPPPRFESPIAARRHAAVRRRSARPQRARQGDQGCRFDLRWVVRSVAGDRHRHDPGRSLGLHRRQGRRLSRVGLQRFHVDSGHSADLRVRGRAGTRSRRSS